MLKLLTVQAWIYLFPPRENNYIVSIWLTAPRQVGWVTGNWDGATAVGFTTAQKQTESPAAVVIRCVDLISQSNLCRHIHAADTDVKMFIDAYPRKTNIVTCTLEAQRWINHSQQSILDMTNIWTNYEKQTLNSTVSCKLLLCIKWP